MTETLINCWEFYLPGGDEVTYYTYTPDSQMARDQVTADEGNTDWHLDNHSTLTETQVLEWYGKDLILDAE